MPNDPDLIPVLCGGCERQFHDGLKLLISGATFVHSRPLGCGAQVAPDRVDLMRLLNSEQQSPRRPLKLHSLD